MNKTVGLWHWLRLVAAGLLLYFLFLLVTLPAHWLGEALTRTTGGVLRLQNASGSIWQGAGTLTLNSVGSAPLTTRLNWDIHPLWLLTGTLRADLQARGEPSLRARIGVGYKSVQLNDLEAEFPAAQLPTFYPPATLIGPTGKIQLTAGELIFNNKGMTGEAQLTWLGAGGRLGGLSEIGDYRLRLSGQDGVVNLQAATLKGAIQLDARGSWQVAGDGMLRLDGTLAADAGHQATLAPLLALLNAKPEGDRHVFNVSMPLQLF